MSRRDVFANIGSFKDFSAEGLSWKVPIRYFRLDAFGAAFTADLVAVKALMPSPRLIPLQVWPGRAVVAFNAFNYLETDIGPYGEFSVGVPCSIRQQGRVRRGIYVHRLPVTSELARVAGIVGWGYPKFTCEMEFENGPREQAVRLLSASQLILELRALKGGFGITQARELPTFTLKNRDIIYTPISFQATVRLEVHGLASLQTGDHEVGRELRGLGLSPSPLFTADFLDANLLLPEGQSLGAG